MLRYKKILSLFLVLGFILSCSSVAVAVNNVVQPAVPDEKTDQPVVYATLAPEDKDKYTCDLGRDVDEEWLDGSQGRDK